jgi:hypothetical protein
MGFLSGLEIGFHADMDLLIPALEPAATPGPERSGLFDFTQPEQRAIEFPGGYLAPDWGGQLNMINAHD